MSGIQSKANNHLYSCHTLIVCKEDLSLPPTLTRAHSFEVTAKAESGRFMVSQTSLFGENVLSLTQSSCADSLGIRRRPVTLAYRNYTQNVR